MNEFWHGTGCRRELLDHTLIWNQAHLRQARADGLINEYRLVA